MNAVGWLATGSDFQPRLLVMLPRVIAGRTALEPLIVDAWMIEAARRR